MDSDQTLSELFQLLWQMYKTVQLSLQQVERCCPRGQFFMLERLGVTIDRHGRDGTIPVSTLAAQRQVEDGLREYMRRVVCRMGEAEFAHMLASCRAWDEAMRAERPAQDGAVPAPCPCGQTQQSQKEETASC